MGVGGWGSGVGGRVWRVARRWWGRIGRNRLPATCHMLHATRHLPHTTSSKPKRLDPLSRFDDESEFADESGFQIVRVGRAVEEDEALVASGESVAQAGDGGGVAGGDREGVLGEPAGFRVGLGLDDRQRKIGERRGRRRDGDVADADGIVLRRGEIAAEVAVAGESERWDLPGQGKSRREDDRHWPDDPLEDDAIDGVAAGLDRVVVRGARLVNGRQDRHPHAAGMPIRGARGLEDASAIAIDDADDIIGTGRRREARDERKPQ